MDWLHSGTSVEYRELFDITGGTTSRIRAKAWMKTIFFFEFLLKNFKIILSFIFKMRSRSTLRAGRFGVWNPWRSRDLYLLQIVQTGCGTHPACYSIGIVVLSLRIKRPEREVNHSPSYSDALLVLPLYAFMTRTGKALLFTLNKALCWKNYWVRFTSIQDIPLSLSNKPRGTSFSRRRRRRRRRRRKKNNNKSRHSTEPEISVTAFTRVHK